MAHPAAGLTDQTATTHLPGHGRTVTWSGVLPAVPGALACLHIPVQLGIQLKGQRIPKSGLPVAAGSRKLAACTSMATSASVPTHSPRDLLIAQEM